MTSHALAARAEPALVSHHGSMSDPERIVVRLRSHGRALIVPTIVLWATCAAVALLLNVVDWPLWNLVVLTLAALLVITLCVVPLLAWLSRRLVVTNRRIIVRSGFGGSRREIALSRIHDVTLRRRGLQRIFGTGDVLVSTGGDRLVTLADLPDAALVQRTITDLLDHHPQE